MEETLIIGYGNVDRQDDGVAWHILAGLWEQFGRGPAPSIDEGFPLGGEYPHFIFDLQLVPELAEVVARYKRVCFVDAHTGAVPEEIHREEVRSLYQNSPFTHHMTPGTCLALSEAFTGKRPDALLISVRGYQFGFERTLSPRTQELVAGAVEQIKGWLAGE